MDFFVLWPTGNPTRIICPECGASRERKPEADDLAWRLALDMFKTYHNACIRKYNARITAERAEKTES